MPDQILTTEHVSLLTKLKGFFGGLGKDAENVGAIIGTLVSDVATIKSELSTGNYPAVLASLQSDVATLKTELAALKSSVVSSVKE